MQKIYLSIIALLILALFVSFSIRDNEPNDATNNEKAELQANQKVKNRDDSKLYQETTKEYFSGVVPKRDIFEGREGVAIHTDEIPKDQKKEYAAGLLLEARKSINVSGNLEMPSLDNIDQFFTPNDEQLVKLLKNSEKELASNILNKSVLLKNANELIANDDISAKLQSIYDNLVEIKIYDQNTLYEFSLSLDQYKKSVISILNTTNFLKV